MKALLTSLLLLVPLLASAEVRFTLQKGRLPQGPMEDFSTRVPPKAGDLGFVQVGDFGCELERLTELYDEVIWVHQVRVQCTLPQEPAHAIGFGVVCNTGSENRDKAHLTLRSPDAEWLLNLRCENQEP